MSETVFVLTDGCYSDFHLVALYSTREVAEEHAKRLGSDANVEEWTIDESAESVRAGRFVYTVWIRRDGKARASLSGVMDATPLEAPILSVRQDCDEGFCIEMYAHVCARDEKHAVKIANEKRASMIASGEWGRLARVAVQEWNVREASNLERWGGTSRVVPEEVALR